MKVGKACHIFAAAAGGPRYNEKHTKEERVSIENGIWLCAHCAEFVDKNNGAEIAAQQLIEWKITFEEKAKQNIVLGKNSSEAWSQEFSLISYINIPRIGMLAALRGYAVHEFEDKNKYFNQMGMSAAPIARQYSDFLRRIGLVALELEEISRIDDPLGLIVKFNRQFRTKNGIDSPSDSTPPFRMSGDLKRDPHIYSKIDDSRFIVVYDPKWITTITAYSEFRPSSGQNKFAGLAVIKSIVRPKKLFLAAPLIIGLPLTDFQKQLWGEF